MYTGQTSSGGASAFRSFCGGGIPEGFGVLPGMPPPVSEVGAGRAVLQLFFRASAWYVPALASAPIRDAERHLQGSLYRGAQRSGELKRHGMRYHLPDGRPPPWSGTGPKPKGYGKGPYLQY